MARILEIAETAVTIEKNDGTVTVVRRCDFDFAPIVGDEIQIYQNGTRTIVSRTEIVPPVDQTMSEINNNINNVNHNTNSQSSYNNSDKTLVSKAAYCLLAIFFGNFGLHKFISGKPMIGLIYLLFFWTGIPGFIGFIEGIIALFAESNKDGEIFV